MAEVLKISALLSSMCNSCSTNVLESFSIGMQILRNAAAIVKYFLNLTGTLKRIIYPSKTNIFTVAILLKLCIRRERPKCHVIYSFNKQ